MLQFMSSCFGRPSLHLEVVSSQLGIVDIQHCLGVEPGGHADLRMELEMLRWAGNAVVSEIDFWC